METKYVQLTNGLITPNEFHAYEENKKERYSIFYTLPKPELTKVISLINSYEVWDKLREIYEGNDRVK